MRIAALNIRSGGNVATIPAIVDRLMRFDPDVVVFSEYRDNRAGAALREASRRRGYPHLAWTHGHRGNGVCIASNRAFTATPNPFGLSDDEYPNAILKAAFADMDLFGLYLPGQDRKRPHLHCLIAAAEYYRKTKRAGMYVGDFNSGRNETDIEINLRSGRLRDEFSTADLYAELETRWTELWAHFHPGTFEFSWYPFRNDPNARSRAGWRIDKAFCSPAMLERALAAEYDHFFRTDRLTDHSAIIVDIRDTGAAATRLPERCDAPRAAKRLVADAE